MVISWILHMSVLMIVYDVILVVNGSQLADEVCPFGPHHTLQISRMYLPVGQLPDKAAQSYP